jgi:RNA polymerase sigma-70 factor (ECF subfamily)
MAGGRRGRDGGGLDPGSEAALAGDSGQASLSEAEFDALMRTHFNDIWRYALRRTATPEDADDVTAEVFATLWRRRDSLPPRPEMRLFFGCNGSRGDAELLARIGSGEETPQHALHDRHVGWLLAAAVPVRR